MKLNRRIHFTKPGMIIGIIIIIILIKLYFFPYAQIIGSSMAPTLQNEQWIMTNRLTYLVNEPNRGDVVTINHGDELYIKRIIGLPNETLAIFDQQLYIDGIPYTQRFLANIDRFWTHNIESITIPDNSYYVMGDNRLFSKDSRNELGFIDRSNIIGRAEFIIYPVSNWQIIH